MSTGRQIKLGKGFRLKDGKPAKAENVGSVSERIRKRKSKRVRVVKRGTS